MSPKRKTVWVLWVSGFQGYSVEICRVYEDQVQAKSALELAEDATTEHNYLLTEVPFFEKATQALFGRLL